MDFVSLPALDIETRAVATLGGMIIADESARGLVGAYASSGKFSGYRLEFRS
jgi:hypothetical protein